MGKASEHLRNAGTLFNKEAINFVDIEQLKENLTPYFNLLALFFKSKSPQESNKIKFLRQGLKTQFHSPFAYS